MRRSWRPRTSGDSPRCRLPMPPMGRWRALHPDRHCVVRGRCALAVRGFAPADRAGSDQEAGGTQQQDSGESGVDSEMPPVSASVALSMAMRSHVGSRIVELRLQRARWRRRGGGPSAPAPPLRAHRGDEGGITPTTYSYFSAAPSGSTAIRVTDCDLGQTCWRVRGHRCSTLIGTFPSGRRGVRQFLARRPLIRWAWRHRRVWIGLAVPANPRPRSPL